MLIKIINLLNFILPKNNQRVSIISFPDFDDQTRKAFEKDDEESVGEQTLYRSERHADFRKKDENLIVFYPSYNTNAESKFLAWAIAAKDEFFIEGTPRAALINTSISQESE